MRPVMVPRTSLEEMRAAVKAFAAEPGPARFQRVCRLMARIEREQRAPDRR